MPCPEEFSSGLRGFYLKSGSFLFSTEVGIGLQGRQSSFIDPLQDGEIEIALEAERQEDNLGVILEIDKVANLSSEDPSQQQVESE